MRRIWFRPVNESDLRIIMNWRMQEKIDFYMKTSPKLNMKIQIEWYKDIILSGKEIRFMIMRENIPIGNVYFNDLESPEEKVSGPGWFLAEKSGIEFRDVINIYYTALHIGFNILNAKCLIGEVMRENIGTKRIIELCGSRLTNSQSSIVYKNGVKRIFDEYSISYSDYIVRNYEAFLLEVIY
jgi:hypothetical protein